jgi:hypothetical protein
MVRMAQDAGVDHDAKEPVCLTCCINRGEIAAPGGVIYEDDLWQLQHDIAPISLVGWLVLKPLCH